MRNYDKPLTFVLTGSGTSTTAHTKTLLEDFIFGTLENVDVKFIVPFYGAKSSSLGNALALLKDWGMDGDDFIPVVEPNGGHHAIASAGMSHQVEAGTSVQFSIDLLSAARSEGRDVAFISIFNPDSEQDLKAIETAKDWDWLSTLNLAEGLIDHFEGYESIEDRAFREAIQQEYQAKMAEDEPEKPIVKKATTPRKRVAKKPVEAEDVPLTEERQKPPVAPEKPKPASGLIANAVAREADKKLARDLAKLAAADMVKHCNVDALDDAERAFLVSSGLYTQKQVDDELAMCAASAKERDKVARKEGEVWEEREEGFVTVYQMRNGKVQSSGPMRENTEPSTELSGTITMSSKLPTELEPAKMVDPTPDVWKDVAAAVPDITHISVAKEDLVKLNEGMQKMAEGFSDVLSAYNNMLGGE
jgi:hypothetical protein